MDRRQILKYSAVAALATSLPAWTSAKAQDSGGGLTQRVLGEAEAPVTIVEYSSLTCPHCARFHTATMPQVKDEWLDAGKAKLVFRHFPLDGLALRASAVTECFEGPRFFAFLELLFAEQQSWSRAGDPIEALRVRAGLAGLDSERFQACVEDEALMRQILEYAREGANAHGIQSTPSFLIDGELVAGAMPYADFKPHLDKALEAAET